MQYIYTIRFTDSSLNLVPLRVTYVLFYYQIESQKSKVDLKKIYKYNNIISHLNKIDIINVKQK